MYQNYIKYNAETPPKYPQTFTGKERDSETGYSYFGARYYDSDLMTGWLSVDPMADKYPSLSPYAYCANNPVKLVDPDGEEVEYASFLDMVIVSTEKLINKDFRIRFNDLKKSEETYVFRNYYDCNKKGGELTTDGNKLFINYNRCRNENQGSDVLVNLRHETEHAIQFEYGEIGFSRSTTMEDFTSENFDLMDEVNARDFEKCGLTLSSNLLSVYNSWNGTDDEKKAHLAKSKAYENIHRDVRNNKNMDKIKTEIKYMLPHRERSYK